MFYGCWYEMPAHGDSILEQTGKRLRPDVLTAFETCILRKSYVAKISPLATRWSVLVTPSLDVAQHRKRIGSDDSRQIAQKVYAELLAAREHNDTSKIDDIEQRFFAHCLACEDRLAFSIVWFRLGRASWTLDAHWTNVYQKLEQSSDTKVTVG